jgi:hypothetical protein
VSDVCASQSYFIREFELFLNCKQTFFVVHSLNNKLPLSPGLAQATSRVLCPFHMSPPLSPHPRSIGPGFRLVWGPKCPTDETNIIYYSFLKCLIHRLDEATLIAWGVRCSRICFGLIGTERPRLCKKICGGSPL